ncbi:tRNA-modifying protein YgfZ [Vibrio sp. WXL103]|uniref:tRNA-modifying protein YgfZ n=1 Tax=Vibrio sp. WXL103 TaxID=3450710 RepID=UPI003EC86B26
MDWNQLNTPLPLTPEEALPALSLCHLNQLGLITLSGDDRKSYLQGQVTCDVVSLATEQSTLGGHCDAKGKLWSAFRLFHHGETYAMLQPQSAVDKELAELKKYAVFSKVTIEVSQDTLLGVIGDQAEQFVDQLSEDRGDVRQITGGTAVKVGQQRWLLALEPTQAGELAKLHPSLWVDSALWTLMDIREAQPVVEDFMQNEHIPQALNLHAVGGISFSKGCYTGQETVARAKYRGMNKRQMVIVQSTTAETLEQEVILERSVGENWRALGRLLCHYQFADGRVIGLAIVPNNLEPDTQLRLAQQAESHWQLLPLPYSLDDE